jgi:F-type H+-transporting ATPase subunit b
MSDLFTQLGIEPVAFLWQAANFAIVLGALWYLVYRPLTALVAERTKKIEQGIEDAAAARTALNRADTDYDARLRDAEREALALIKEGEQDARTRASAIIAHNESRGEAIIVEARMLAERVREEELAALEAEAKSFVEAVVAKTVELDPSAVDEKLVHEAVRLLRAEHHRA